MPARLRYNSSAAARRYNDENNSYGGGRARALYDTSTGAPPDFGNVCAHGYQQASVVAAARQGLFLIPVVFILPNLLGLAGVEYAQPAADLLAFALALPMGLSVLKTFRSDAPTPAHTLREE